MPVGLVKLMISQKNCTYLDLHFYKSIKYVSQVDLDLLEVYTVTVTYVHVH